MAYSSRRSWQPHVNVRCGLAAEELGLALGRQPRPPGPTNAVAIIFSWVWHLACLSMNRTAAHLVLSVEFPLNLRALLFPLAFATSKAVVKTRSTPRNECMRSY